MSWHLQYALAILNTTVVLLLLILGFVVYRLHIRLGRIRSGLDSHFVDLFRQLQIMPLLRAKVPLRGHLPPLRGWAASPDFLLVITERISVDHPQTVVECGSGSSTIYIARALQMNGGGHLYSLEHDQKHAARTRRLLIEHDLQAWATVLDAPLKQYRLHGRSCRWYDTSGLPPSIGIDLLVIDGPSDDVGRMVRYPAGPTLFPLLTQGGVAFLDDADRPDERRAVELWLEEFQGAQLEEYPCEKGCVSFKLSARSVSNNDPLGVHDGLEISRA